MPRDDDDVSGIRAFPTRPPPGGKPKLTPAEQQAKDNLSLLEIHVGELTTRVQALERARPARESIADLVREAASAIEEVLHQRQNKLRDTLQRWRGTLQESLARAILARTIVSLPPVPELPPLAFPPEVDDPKKPK